MRRKTINDMGSQLAAVSLGLLMLAGLTASCSRTGASAPDTGILLEVTLADNPANETVDNHIARLEFLVAYESSQQPGKFVLISAEPIPVRDISGRSLISDPWRELLVPKKDKGLKVRVLVMAKKADGELLALGKLEEPDFQEFIPGRIAKRTILLRAQNTGNPDITITDTGCIEIWATGEVLFRSPADYDCDGYRPKDVGGDDCNDKDPNVHPGAVEICDNGIDDDCNGKTDYDDDTDDDGDGVSKCQGDCDDTDRHVHPGAAETPANCGKDNDCNGLCDDDDEDGDHWNTCGTWKGRTWDPHRCAPHDPKAVDCNAHDSSVHPGAPEICDNGIDDNCNGKTDYNDDTDNDRDGVGKCQGDCDDTDRNVHPGALEVCNGVDDDCDGWCDWSDGMPDDSFSWDRDGDGWTTCGSFITQSHTCDNLPDCDEDRDWVNPGAEEICDGYDTDCDSGTTVDVFESQCFSPADIDLCQEGSATCRDDDPDDPWHCVVDADSEILPRELCVAYADCYQEYLNDPETWPTPFDCLTNSYAWPPTSSYCEVVFTGMGQGEALCAYPPVHELPICSNCNSCPWTLFISDDLDGWNIELASIPWNEPGTVIYHGMSFDPCIDGPYDIPVIVAEPPDAWSSNTNGVTAYLIWEPDMILGPAAVSKVTFSLNRNNICPIEPNDTVSRGMDCDFSSLAH